MLNLVPFAHFVHSHSKDDDQWEPDETFFVKLSLANNQQNARIGDKAVCMVTIIDDDSKLTDKTLKNDYKFRI